jgi:hypothetical protein
MKLKHAALALAMTGTAFGGSVTVTNINAGSTQLVLDNAGNPVVGGFVGVGTVTDPGADFATLTGSDLAGLFDSFATGTTTDPGATAILDLAMSFEVTGSDNFNSSALAGQPIYLVLGTEACRVWLRLRSNPGVPVVAWPEGALCDPAREHHLDVSDPVLREAEIGQSYDPRIVKSRKGKLVNIPVA